MGLSSFYTWKLTNLTYVCVSLKLFKLYGQRDGKMQKYIIAAL